MVMKKHKPRPRNEQSIALILIGVGMIAFGLMTYLLLATRPNEIASGSSSNLAVIPAQVNYPAPQLDLTSLKGEAVSLSDYAGQVVLVNLWATWCPPCREEMPVLNAFYQEYSHLGFTIVAISQEEPREVVEPFVDEFGLQFPVWLDETYLAERAFNTMNLPSSYVIDRDGQVRLSWVGKIDKSNLERYVPQIIME